MKIYELKRKIREDLKRLHGDKTMVKNLMRNSQHRVRPVAKSIPHSERARVAGNELFKHVDYEAPANFQILHLYNESVAFAPPESAELAAAYGNKSALLWYMLKFEHCITEADKALAITQSITLKIKLLCRKAECFTVLESSESIKCIEKAQFLLKKTEDSDKTKKMLSKLIEKTQLFMVKPNVENPIKEKIFDRVQKQSLRMVREIEKSTSIQDSFKIEYSKKYGHQLVAARDFEPGEMICVERAYHSQIVDSKTPSYCFQCGRFLWTIVACDYCSWHVYCSEQCKSDTWNEYHDMECSATQHMKEVLPINEYVDSAPSIIFFKALKEAGSISQLQAELEMLDKLEDHHSDNLMENQKFSSYKTLCLTPIPNLPKQVFDSCIRSATFCLIGYAKPVLKATYTPYNLKMLMKDEDAISVGAFLCKLQIINKGRVQSGEEFDPFPSGCIYGPKINVTVLTSLLMPISCVPNVGHCPTSDRKFIFYAMEPIKAGDQLFSSIWLSSVYYNTPKSQRDLSFRSLYDFPCECRACTNDWDGILNNLNRASRISDTESALLKELSAELYSIKTDMETSSRNKMNLIHVQLIDRTRALVAKAWKHFPMPSMITLEAVKFMVQLFETFFPHYNRISFRPQSIGVGGPFVFSEFLESVEE